MQPEFLYCNSFPMEKVIFLKLKLRVILTSAKLYEIKFEKNKLFSA